jgi:hypothetical protein
MSEERFEETVRRLAQDYHRPPEPPREEMWAAIQEERMLSADHRRPVWKGWAGWSTVIAAALLIGVGLGRLSVRPDAVTVAAAPAAAPAPEVAYQLAATQYLSQAEALLTSFRSESGAGQPDAQLTAWASDLLSTTRLLLDSPAAEDARMRVLLEDLELILAQIAQLAPRESAAPPAEEVEIVRQAIDQGGVLPKLRTAIPAGTTPVETEEE